MLGFALSRENDRTLDATSAQRSCGGKTLAQFPSQSSGSRGGAGLLHRTHDPLRLSLLLLRDRPRSSAHPALPRQLSSEESVDHPAVAGGVCIPGGSPVSDLRPGCAIRMGGPGHGSLSAHEVRCGPAAQVLGRMVERSAGWKAVGEICWSTSSRCMSAIGNPCSLIMSTTILTTARLSDLGREHRTAGFGP